MPESGLPMRGAPGPCGTIGLGGLFTVLKARGACSQEGVRGYYQPPAASRQPPAASRQPARRPRAQPDRLRRDGIDPEQRFEPNRG